MAKINLDKHGPYFRFNNHVFRPQRNFTEQRIFDSYPGTLKASMPTGTIIPVGANIKPFSWRYVSIRVNYTTTATTVYEVWSEHGVWTGNSEDAWMASKQDLENEKYATQPVNKALEGATMILRHLLGL